MTQEEGDTVVIAGETAGQLAFLLADFGHPLNTRCGQRGWCHGCEVEVIGGSVRETDGTEVAAPALVRACQMQTWPGVETRIHIPARSRLHAAPKVAETFVCDIPTRHDPLFTSIAGSCDTGCAIDLGTTTVVVLLSDLTDGTVLGRQGSYNAQTAFGDNVLTRIAAAADPAVRAEMRRVVIEETLAPLIRKACAASGRSPDRIAGVTVAGNTTMLHLLANEDPSPLGIAPFTPRFLSARTLTAAETGLDQALTGWVADLRLLPGLSAYVGADLTAGILATGMLFDSEPSLLIDMGTNGEIVLQRDGRLIVSATAAGPAFEGSGLLSGQRAQHGAISTLRIHTHPTHFDMEIIGGVAPESATGLCGSAYLDFLAEGRRMGLLTANGRFHLPLWKSLPESQRAIVDGIRAVRLTPGAVISEVDVALLLQAKAAIGAGIETLLAAAEMAPSGLSKIYLAGGFGLHLNAVNALAIGLLPDVPSEKIQVVGNSSLGGAHLALMDRSLWQGLESMRDICTVVELNLDPDFEDRYIGHLELP